MNMRFIGIAAGASADRLRVLGATVFLEDYSDQEAFWQAVRAASAPKMVQRGNRS
jgi:hypothetical protein